jgi:hypothetical protein
MKTINFVLVLLSAFVSVEVYAGAKATVKTSRLALLKADNTGWKTIMKSKLRTPNNKAILVDLSLECALFTSSTVTTSMGDASAAASVDVRVLIDGIPIEPGDVTFCRRTASLSTKLAGILKQCKDGFVDGVLDGVIDVATECTQEDQKINLMLDTVNASSFQFVAAGLSATEHTIQVQAKIDTKTSGDSVAQGMIGKGTLSAEVLRIVDPIRNEVMDLNE